MQDQVFKILVAMADPLCPLEPVQHGVGNGRQRLPWNSAAESPARGNLGVRNLAAVTAFVAAVADKWWLLFAARP